MVKFNGEERKYLILVECLRKIDHDDDDDDA